MSTVTTRKQFKDYCLRRLGFPVIEINVDDDQIEDDEHVGTLHLPLTCQVKHGSGEFVFMGRKRLGDAVLFCAPRLEEWQQWIQQAQNDGSAQCRLQF